MPGFVLKDAVEELTYDFEPYPVSSQKDMDEFEGKRKGTIPEPSATQIQNFRTSIAELLSEMIPEGLDDEVTKAVEMRKALLEVIAKDQTAMQQKSLHALAEVCSNQPSFDVLNALPYRHQQAFSGWITGVFLLPQVPTPATKG
jgi:hypothetical protein